MILFYQSEILKYAGENWSCAYFSVSEKTK